MIIPGSDRPADYGNPLPVLDHSRNSKQNAEKEELAMADIEQAVPQQKPQRSWFGRNWWWVLLIILIGGVAICSGLCGVGMFLAFGQLRESEPYKMTLAAVTSDPVVIDKLGEPIEDATQWVPNIQISVTNDQGNARIMIPIRGPKGTANVSSVAKMNNGKWALTQVEATFSDGQRHLLELGADQAGGIEAALPWNPAGVVPDDTSPTE